MKYALLTILALLPSSAVASLDQTVGWTGGCTCVVIHPDGWALTAEHCGHSKEGFTVEIDGRTVQAREVYDPPKNSTDEAVLVKLDGAAFKWAKVATESMKVGDRFYSWGFPAGNISYITGKVIPAEMDGESVVAADGAAIGGHSGGPLFNARGEVCGLLSTSDRASVSTWISLASIHEAMTHMQAGNKPAADRKVWVLTSTGCIPCENLKADYRRGQFPGIEMEFIDGNTTGGQELREQIRKATGQLPVFTPTLWAEGAKTFTTGYSGVGTVRSWLVGIFSLPIGFWETITGDRVGPDQKLEPQPETEPFPSPKPEIKPAPQSDGLVPIPTDPPEEDVFHGVTVIFTAAAQDVSALRGGARRLALEQLIPAIERQFAELTGGDARLAVVPERTLPTRYAAVTEAAEIPGDGWHVLVLVPAQSSGIRQLIRSKIAELVRDRLPDAVRDAPVGLLSETVSEGVYRATLTALNTPEPKAEPLEPREGGDPTSGDVPWPVAIGTAIVGLIRRLLGGKS